MRFHGILLTRDDDDIIAQCIQHALTWCDALYVFDTGSGDATCDIVKDLANKDNRIKVVSGHPKPLVLLSSLRGVFFNQIRHFAQKGDWFVQVDSDEFCHISPRQFVEEQLHPCETCVWNLIYEFRLTSSEVLFWKQGCETFTDRNRPIADRRRYYNLLRWTEPRMFRYRPSMQWKHAYPYNTGFVARNRIPIRHYPHRDVLQLKKRWLLRKLMAPLAESNWKHWQHSDWMKLVANDDSPDLRYWPPGSVLPIVQDPHHLARWPKRAAQRVAHKYFLPFLDVMRPRVPKEYVFNKIPAEVEANIQKSMCSLEGSGYL